MIHLPADLFPLFERSIIGKLISIKSMIWRSWGRGKWFISTKLSTRRSSRKTLLPCQQKSRTISCFIFHSFICYLTTISLFLYKLLCFSQEYLTSHIQWIIAWSHFILLSFTFHISLIPNIHLISLNSLDHNISKLVVSVISWRTGVLPSNRTEQDHH